MPRETLDLLCEHARETALLQSVLELLEWDERTKMPTAAGEFRAEQITYLSGATHKRRTDSRIGDWLAELEDGPLAADPHSDTGATIRQMRRDYDRLVKVPQALVEELSRAAVLGQQQWVQSRMDNDFDAFEPTLSKIVDLKRREAEAVGYEKCPYDALLDDHEPDETTENVTLVLEQLRRDLVPLVAAIGESDRKPKLEILTRTYPAAKQESFGKQAAAAIGFDFKRGRLDVTDHPFCSGLAPDDCRITTRYVEQFFPSAFFGILHEAGHGLYEQGLRGDRFGLPPGSYTSLGIHESQSRMWENLVGRSRSFWQHLFPSAQATFPEALGDVTVDDFFFAVNHVRPSLIRVEADEATYNLHIIIRFELEQALVNDELPVRDLRSAWNEKYREYLGVAPSGSADGVLQDIHWSAALIGYFPTYSLGNLYASQFFEQADSDLGGLDHQFRDGDFAPLLDWLREKIHRHGQCYSASELVERVTGAPLSHGPLLRHLKGKFGELYGL